MPHRAYGMHDPASARVEPRRNPRFTRRAWRDGIARVIELGAGCAKDRAANAASARQLLVRRIDDCVHGQRGDVVNDDRYARTDAHQLRVLPKFDARSFAGARARGMIPRACAPIDAAVIRVQRNAVAAFAAVQLLAVVRAGRIHAVPYSIIPG
jgi:hypothetical protein